MKLFATVSVALAVVAGVHAQDEPAASTSIGTSPASTSVVPSSTSPATQGGSSTTSTAPGSTVTGAPRTGGSPVISISGLLARPPVVNPALNEKCKAEAFLIVTPIIEPCGLQSALNSLTALGSSGKTVTPTDAAAVFDTVFTAPVLTGFCTDACMSAITKMGQGLVEACGTTPILIANGATPAEIAPVFSITAADIVPIISYARPGLCVKEAGAFCVVNQWTLLRPVVASNGVTPVPKALDCTPCAKKQSDAWGAASGLPVAFKPTVDNALAELKKTLSACPAESLVSKDNNSKDNKSGAQVASGAAAALAGAVGLAGALIVG